METKRPWQDYFDAIAQQRLTVEEAVAKLDAIDASDPEDAHVTADNVVNALLPPEVQAAYARVMGRARWWAYA